MSNVVGRIVRIGLLVLFVIVLVLTVFLFLTGSFLIMKTLLVIGGISFFAALSVLILKFTGFYGLLKISNPTGMQATDIAAVLGIIGIFCYMAPTISGAFSIPTFARSVQNFMSNQEGTTGEILKILRGLDARIPPSAP